MNIEIKGFLIPHNEEPYYTCADRYAIGQNTNAFAIADGVGGSLYPSFLSERITKDFVNNPQNFFDSKSLLLSKDYYSEFESYYQIRYNELSPAKQQILDLKTEQTKASSCTFVGCYLDNAKWKYYALGDSYLFFISKDGTMHRYSSMDGKEFDVFPEYFSTNGKHNGRPIYGDFPLQDGTLLMMTDALSDWFIKYYEQDRSLLNRLLSLQSHKEYKELCNDELALGRLGDDDCALVVISIINSDKPQIKYSIKHLDNINDLSTKELQELAQKKEADIKNNKSEIRRLSEENKLLKEQIGEVKEKFENEKKIHKQDNETNQLAIDNLKRQINQTLNKPIDGQPLDKTEKLENLIREIEKRINILISQKDSSQSIIQQSLQKIKEEIDSLSQYIQEKDKEEEQQETTPNTQESEIKPKKKLKNVFDWIKKNTLLLLSVITIILLVISFFKK